MSTASLFESVRATRRAEAIRAINRLGPGAVLFAKPNTRPRPEPRFDFTPCQPESEPLDLLGPRRRRPIRGCLMLVSAAVLAYIAVVGLTRGDAPYGIMFAVFAVMQCILAFILLGLQPIRFRTAVWDGRAVTFGCFSFEKAFSLHDSCVVVEPLEHLTGLYRLWFYDRRGRRGRADVDRELAERFIAAWRAAGDETTRDEAEP